MKTVKRKANVGEYILFTKVDIGKVDWVDDKAMCVSVGNKAQILTHMEYEVIIENETEDNEMGIIEQLQVEINELKSKVAALEGSKVSMREASENTYRAMVEGKPSFLLASTGLFTKSPQQIRDDIVAKAKEDVSEVVNDKYFEYLFHYKNHAGDDVLGGTRARVEFVTNFEKRTVVALVRSRIGSRIYAKGIAKADPNDCFNEHIGKAIALRRALRLEVPAEYYNVPAPTEVRVGDVVKSASILNKTYRVTEDFCRRSGNECALTSVVAKNGKVIDDSRSELEEINE